MADGHATEPDLQGCHWTAQPESVPAGSQVGMTWSALCLSRDFYFVEISQDARQSLVPPPLSFALASFQGFFPPCKET